MVSLARKNLLKDLPRFLVAQAGIMFAVSLVTIQTGILKGFTQSTTLLIEQSSADIWVSSDNIVNFELTEPFPYLLLQEARRVAGVAQVEPLVIGSGRWYAEDGDLTTLRIFGFAPDGELFTPGDIPASILERLKEPYTAIVDKTNLRSLEIDGVGSTARIRSLPVEVVGLTEQTQSIVSSKFVFTSLENAQAYVSEGYAAQLTCQINEGNLDCTNRYERTFQNTGETAPAPPQSLTADAPVTYLLVEAAPGTDLSALKQRLTDTLPDTQAFTQDELIETTQTYWLNSTGIGFVLALGAAVGVIVGIVIVAQILYTSVSEHLKEFATLKAMGASDWRIYGVIVEQALWMALLGYAPGIGICWGVAAWAMAGQGILILITPVSALSVLGITVVMCLGSASFAIQKVMRVDPGLVFKG